MRSLYLEYDGLIAYSLSCVPLTWLSFCASVLTPLSRLYSLSSGVGLCTGSPSSETESQSDAMRRALSASAELNIPGPPAPHAHGTPRVARLVSLLELHLHLLFSCVLRGGPDVIPFVQTFCTLDEAGFGSHTVQL